MRVQYPLKTMKFTKISFNLNNTAIPIYEDFFYNCTLNQITKFNLTTLTTIPQCIVIALNFGFKEINFEKKYMVLYFFLLEIFTAQKCIITNSSKNLISFKIKKGSVTGCKVSLQNENLYNFLDTLLLGLPRSDIFHGFSFKKSSEKQKTFSTKIKEFFIFYPLEMEITSNIKLLDITFKFNIKNDFYKCFLFSHYKIPLKFFN